MREGGVIAQSFEIDEFNQNIWILLSIACVSELNFDILNLSVNYFLFGGFIFGFSDHFDQSSGLFADQVRDFAILKEIIHMILFGLL
jgi:hypothetical protein